MKWISVKDRLPEEIGLYAIRIYEPLIEKVTFFDPIPANEEIKWAYYTWKQSFICNESDNDITYNKEWGFFINGQQSSPLENVTHWMPLPDAPKEE